MNDSSPAQAFRIAPLSAEDYPFWYPLWRENNGGVVQEDVTQACWAHVMASADGESRKGGDGASCVSGIYGLGAWAGPDMAGILHYVLHPVTGTVRPVCYMQDVFVDPAFRRRGVGRALVCDLARRGAQAQWARIYWLAETGDEAAQTFYKNIGIRLDFTLHVWPLNL